MKTIYLDYAAATPLDPEVQKAMEPFLAERYYNPSSLYTPAREVKKALEHARHQVAQVLGAKSMEVIFVAGASEANNIALKGILDQYPGSEILSSSIEHESVRALSAQTIKVNSKGILDLKDLQKKITDKTVLVSVMYANHEIGTIQPLKEIAKIINTACDKRQKHSKLPLFLHTDASQAANCLDLHVGRLGVDLMTISSSKIYGPKQVAALYVQKDLRLQPQILGGGQEQGIRAGTENVAGAVGMALALQKAQSGRKIEGERQQVLRDHLYAAIKSKIEVAINGDINKRLPNNLNLSFPGANGETFVHYLDQAGVLVGTGAACSTTSDQPSPVLRAIGLSDEEANSSLRITLGRQTSAADIKKAAELIIKSYEKIKAVYKD